MKIKLIILFASIFTLSNAQNRIDVSVKSIIEVLVKDAPDAKIEHLKYKNEFLHLENYKNEFLPTIANDISLLNFNRSIKELQNASTGDYTYIDDYSNSSSIGLSISQKIAPTGGNLTINSNLSYLHEFSSKRDNFTTTPISISYTQDIRGGSRNYRYDRILNEVRNSVSIKNYCLAISNIEKQAVSLYMDAVVAKCEVLFFAENIKSTDSLLYVSSVMHENGKLTKYELRHIEFQKISMDISYTKAKDNYQNAIKDFCAYLGIEDGNDINLLLPSSDIVYNIDLNRMLELVDKYNPFKQNSDMEKIKYEKELYNKKLSNGFNAKLNLSYGVNQFGDNIIDSYYNPNRRQGASISLRIPIFRWGINKNNYTIAQNNYTNSCLDIDHKKIDFSNKITRSISEYNIAISTFSLSKRRYELSQDMYNMAIDRMLMGKINIEQLFDIQNDQEQASLDFYKSLRQLWLSYFEIRSISLYDFSRRLPLKDYLVQ